MIQRKSILTFALLLYTVLISFGQKNIWSVDMGIPLTSGIQLNQYNHTIDLAYSRAIRNKLYVGFEFYYLRTDLMPMIGDLIVHNRKIYDGFFKCTYFINTHSKLQFVPEIKTGFAFVKYNPSLKTYGFSVAGELNLVYPLSEKISLSGGVGCNTIFYGHPITLPSHFSSKEKIINQFRMKIGFMIRI